MDHGNHLTLFYEKQFATYQRGTSTPTHQAFAAYSRARLGDFRWGTYGHTAVDNLTYTYQTNNANQLYTVTDATGNQTGFGIQTGGSASGHYVYDPNGNLTTDPYKYLTIGYNVLNKTDKITMSGYTGRFEYYVYDATGTVMEKQQWDSGTLQHTTVYTDGFVYIDGTIAYITTPEGRADYNGSTFTNEYIISDQQGNARISFNNTGTSGAREVIQENSYYGFGMVMPGSVVALPTTPNKNLYNGQSEWQNDYSNMPDYYQTPGRNYDAEIGRFISADPMPESSADLSTYHYAGDNPIMMNDPSGNRFTTTYNNLNPQYNSNYYTLNATTRQSEQIANDMSNEAEGNFGMDGGWSGSATDKAAFLNYLLRLATNICFNNNNVDVDLTQSDLHQMYNTWSTLSAGDVMGLAADANGNVNITLNRETASLGGDPTTGFSNGGVLSGATGYTGAMATYVTNWKVAIAMAVGEANDNQDQVRADASTIINRTDAANTSFWDPNWLSKISDGDICSSWNCTCGNNVDYNGIFNQDFNKTLNSSNIYVQDAIAVYNCWDDVDYSNSIGYPDTGYYYLNATSKLRSSTYGNGAGYCITAQFGGMTYYRSK